MEGALLLQQAEVEYAGDEGNLGWLVILYFIAGGIGRLVILNFV